MSARPTDGRIADRLIAMLERQDSVRRSPEFIAGRSAAVRKFGGHAPAPWPELPYPAGSAQADAWMAGYTAGREAVANQWTEAVMHLLMDEVWA